ncbi:MAG: 2-amino-4-hydroxy-6-hydroxymethyldihydropteridine diphosphokinase, partial [Proteobacteria bacterium]|nr:2-amino-4-hydroxy-6-hydroxymethyldihydropteridine diphosphokinase [Pseudomonadota bacterium]
MNHEVYLALGSNMGDRIENVRSALDALNDRADINIIARSSFYETEPVGVTEQAEFINAAIRIKTSLSPRALLKLVKSIEKALGRVKTVRWGPRVIDIDILLYDDLILSEKELKIP